MLRFKFKVKIKPVGHFNSLLYSNWLYISIYVFKYIKQSILRLLYSFTQVTKLKLLIKLINWNILELS